jgi:decaprenyl-phosphate phosphoribosyltransferase
MKKTLYKYLSLFRPHHWLKNLLLLFPPFFGAKLLEPQVTSAILPALISFSFAASCVYIFNDILDRNYDRLHVSKKYRAIASGDISLLTASVIAGLLYLAAMIVGGSVSTRFQGFLIIYFFLSCSYTLYFKNLVIADIFFVAFGFLVRVLAGGQAFNIRVTNWLFLTVFIVALFLATGKRLGELISLKEDAQKHRLSLNHYSVSFLEGILWFCASTALVTYALYTIENEGAMFYTVPLAAFGLIRYIYIVKTGNGDPTDALLKDPPLTATGILWVAAIGNILYAR